MKNFLFAASVAFASAYASSASAYLENQKIPVCMGDDHVALSPNNAQILEWKRSSRNQFLGRGYAAGTVKGNPWLKGEHTRFIMMLGPNAEDGLEVIYNTSFGKVPTIKDGDSVVVCGDYITSTAAAGGYEPSPVGAIIHWVHYNPGDRSSSKKHEHGFIALDSTLIGFDRAPTEAWDGDLKGVIPARGTVTSPRAPSRPDERGTYPAPRRPQGRRH